MSSCKVSRHGGSPSDMNSLREEFSAVYAMLKEMMVFDRNSLYKEYMEKIGYINLRIFILSVEVMELRLRYREIMKRRSRGETPDIKAIETEVSDRLKSLKKLIDRNSSDLLVTMSSSNPDNEEINVLTELLKQITSLAHPIFYAQTDFSSQAHDILVRAGAAYEQRDRALLERLLGESRSLSLACHPGCSESDAARIKDGIAGLHAEIEEKSLLFPLILRHRISNPIWTAEEVKYLEAEYSMLIEEKNDYRKKLSAFL